MKFLNSQSTVFGLGCWAGDILRFIKIFGQLDQGTKFERPDENGKYSALLNNTYENVEPYCRQTPPCWHV